MIASTTPPNPQSGDGPEDIDRLLARFFRGEVPTPWPTFAPPTLSPVRVRGAGVLSASRLALAASVAALLLGGWFLNGRLPGVPVDGGSLDTGKASVPAEMRRGATHSTMPPARPR
jgi:hypothetical protein